MSTEDFIDYIINEYEMIAPEESGHDSDSFWKEVMTYYSDSMLKASVTKKNAARILYAFLRHVIKIPNVDWNNAKRLRDIYECRVCAEAIAQTYERGIINASAETAFGINDVMMEADLRDSVRKTMNYI